MRMYILLMLVLILSSCHGSGPSTYPTGQALGIYQGTFGKGVLVVVLNYINGDIVSGYDLCKGVRRNINGKLTPDKENLDFTLNEPGDNPLDGTFFITLDTAHLGMTGTWKPLHADKATEKELALGRQVAGGDDSKRRVYEVGWEGNGKGGISFKEDGSCYYRINEHPEDSTSQVNEIKGTFISKGDTVIIDWEKNVFTPAPQMKLIMVKAPYGSDDPKDSILNLKGGGWTFLQQMAG